MINSILFMGTPDFAVRSLEQLVLDLPKSKLTVFSQLDKERGRGKQKSPTPVKHYALEQKLDVYTPRDKHELESLTHQINPDLIIVVAYGMMIPKTVTDKYLCLNIHGSLLPKYRGASPIQTTLLNGDSEAGISIIKLSERMDAGPIVHTSSLPVTESDNCETLFNKLAELGAVSLSNILIKSWPFNETDFTDQDESLASYCGKIQKEDTQLQDTDSAEVKYNKIRAFSPKPGAYLLINNKRLKILESKLENNQCVPLTVQPEGKKAMSFSDYCLGNPEAKELFNV